MMMMICSVILCVFEGIRPQFDVSAVLGINAGVGPRLTKYWSWFGAIQVYQCGTLEKKELVTKSRETISGGTSAESQRINDMDGR